MVETATNQFCQQDFSSMSVLKTQILASQSRFLEKNDHFFPQKFTRKIFQLQNFHKKQKQHKSIPTYKSKTPNSRNIIFN